MTGASGFLGAYIYNRLRSANQNVITLGTIKGDVICDLRNEIPKIPEGIDYLVHVAGKAHMVPKTSEEKRDFYEVNVKGTENLLAGILESGSTIKGIVFISSVAVYGLDSGSEISEESDLLATDPYGASKIEVEVLLKEFAAKRDMNCLILRLPLLAGKNPPGNLGAMINAIKKGWYLSIGKATARKSMVLAEDVAEFVFNNLDKNGVYNLTDEYHPSFKELEKAISSYIGSNRSKSIPQFLAIIFAKIGDLLGKRSPINSRKLRKIQSELTFSSKKAVKELSWKPGKVIDNIHLLFE